MAPPKPVRALHEKLRGAEGKNQFPVSLVWTRYASGGPSADERSPEQPPENRCVTLSWGYDDRESFVTVVPLEILLGKGMGWVTL